MPAQRHSLQRPSLQRLRRRLPRVWLYLFVIGFGAVMVLPFYYMIITSLKTLEAVSQVPVSLAPTSPTLEPYRNLLSSMPYGRFVVNSLIVAVATTLGTLFFCTLAGYAFAKHQFTGRRVLFGLILATMLIPSSVLLVPGFLLMRDLGWLNSFWPLIVPHVTGAFGIFLSRQFIAEIPDDFLEAARIDGCSDFRIYLQIILPLSKPLLATLGILTFLANWNSFVSPLIFLFDEELFTLPLGLALLQGPFKRTENVLMAGAALAIIPVLVLFFLFQKQIVKGLASSGLKG